MPIENGDCHSCVLNYQRLIEKREDNDWVAAYMIISSKLKKGAPSFWYVICLFSGGSSSHFIVMLIVLMWEIVVDQWKGLSYFPWMSFSGYGFSPAKNVNTKKLLNC